MNKSLPPEAGRDALRAWLKEKSPLGPLKATAKYVGRFFQIPLPFFHPYVVYGPEANRKVLVTERDKVLWRNTDPVTDLLNRGVLIVDGEEHDQYRKLMEPALHPSTLSRYAPLIIAHTERVSSQWQDGDVVDMLVESRKIALLIIMDTLFSKDAWDDIPRIWNPILKAIEYISPGAWILWRKIPRFGFRKPLKELDDYLFGIITNRRQQIAEHEQSSTDKHHDLLQHLIEAGLSDQLIRDQMLTMMIAGHDTSTALLAWVFALLGQHPEIHKKVVGEVDSLEKSPLLDQVIKESLRLYPPIHIGNRRMAQAMEFDEGTVPAGERTVLLHLPDPPMSPFGKTPKSSAPSVSPTDAKLRHLPTSHSGAVRGRALEQLSVRQRRGSCWQIYCNTTPSNSQIITSTRTWAQHWSQDPG
jgi:cytochrome P450